MTDTVIATTFHLKCISVEFLICLLGKRAALAITNLFKKPNLSMFTDFDL